VAFNLEALTRQDVRAALLAMLQHAAMDPEVHVSPRMLWAFWYRLLTGGVERYGEGSPTGSYCDVVREKAATRKADWLLSGQFPELLASQRGAGPLWAVLADQDPAFAPVKEIDALHTRLSIKSELDNDEDTVRQMGGEGNSLCGVALHRLTAALSGTYGRRDAAVRRMVYFHPGTFEKWLTHAQDREFRQLLDAYRLYSAGQTLPKDLGNRLKELVDLVAQVFQQGPGHRLDGVSYLKLSQPSQRGTAELLVRADEQTLKKVFKLQQVLSVDIHIAAHKGRETLLEMLGYRPRTVVLNVQRIRLSVDLDVYGFLRRVHEGQKPSERDLSRFQALFFIGERIGNAIAKEQAEDAQELFVYDNNIKSLHRLSRDAFGQVELVQVTDAH
jgi:hypothetical protein